MNTNPEKNNSGVGDTISSFWTQIKTYLGIEVAYAKITATEKLTILLSALTVGAILLVVCAMALFYLSLALIFSLHSLVGGYSWALLIATGCLLVLGAVVYIFRMKLIVNPISRYLSKLFLDPPTNNNVKQDE